MIFRQVSSGKWCPATLGFSGFHPNFNGPCPMTGCIPSICSRRFKSPWSNPISMDLVLGKSSPETTGIFPLKKDRARRGKQAPYRAMGGKSTNPKRPIYQLDPAWSLGSRWKLVFKGLGWAIFHFSDPKPRCLSLICWPIPRSLKCPCSLPPVVLLATGNPSFVVVQNNPHLLIVHPFFVDHVTISWLLNLLTIMDMTHQN